MSSLFSKIKAAFVANKKEEHSTHSDGIALEIPQGIDLAQTQQDFYRHLLGGDDQAKPLNMMQKLVLDVVKQNLREADTRIKAVPRLPSVIPRLLQSLRDPDGSAKDHVNIINKDPAMSTAVLRLANSVYFNPREKRITSIEQAVVKLGIDGLRSVLSAAVMQPVIQRKSPYYSQFGHKLWEHSLCCAIACELSAKQRGLEPYKAYLLGLVHDIGKITIFSELSQQFKLNPDPENPGFMGFVPLMSTDSARLSHQIACDWKLPEEICSALKQQVNIEHGQQMGPYAHLLFQANLACELYLIYRADPAASEQAEAALGTMALPADLFAQLDTLSSDLKNLA